MSKMLHRVIDFVTLMAQEVEEDKKKAAKLNALVQMVPSTDWPERKEPPEFANPPRTNTKSKPAKEHHEHSHQYQPASAEGRKSHTFAQVCANNLSQFAVCRFALNFFNT